MLGGPPDKRSRMHDTTGSRHPKVHPLTAARPSVQRRERGASVVLAKDKASGPYRADHRPPGGLNHPSLSQDARPYFRMNMETGATGPSSLRRLQKVVLPKCGFAGTSHLP
jgi:hypothetical protein